MFFSSALMHIPDGFLSITVSAIYWLLSVVVVGFALRRVNQDLGERQVPLMGVIAAAIFASQMLNFTVIGGTSGHLLGAALATVLLGPWAAVLVMTAVVGVQALVFQDGGLLVLGANLFNMAIVAVAVAHWVSVTLRRLFGGGRKAILAAGFAAAWASVLLAALSTGLQLALSGTSPAEFAIPAMGGIHALIGVGEGLITVGALSLLFAARRDLFENTASTSDSRLVWLGGLAISLALVTLSPFASTNPDGLETVAKRLGFIDSAQPLGLQLIPDYHFPNLSSPALATILAGLVGVLAVLAVVILIRFLFNKRKASNS